MSSRVLVLGSRVGLAGLAAFLVADVALVGLALRSTQAGAEPVGGRPGAKGGISAAGAKTTTPVPVERASAPVGRPRAR